MFRSWRDRPCGSNFYKTNMEENRVKIATNVADFWLINLEIISFLLLRMEIYTQLMRMRIKKKLLAPLK